MGALGSASATGRAPFGIIGAMEVEVDLLRNRMAAEGEVREEQLGSRAFTRGTISCQPVVLAQCDVGMVNAAACAQTLVDRFGVRAVLNTGVAGSLDAAIDIGDIVMATDAVNHLMDVGNLGYEPGQTPGMPTLAFPCDPALRAAAQAAAKQLGMIAHEGRVASGDRFVRDDTDKQRIAQTFGARCCEMEGAAIAQVCSLAGVPCIIVRAISDKADGTDHIDYPAFEVRAARDCAELTARMLAELA